jgi:hypothetical protein
VGFRDFVMRDGYYRLNGQPFYLQGLLNQAIYPDTLYTPTDEHTLTDYQHTLDQGFNGERRHQTTPRHRDLWLADRMGYWLTIELPSGRNLLRDDHRADAVDQWKRIVRAYAWNHPCVFFLCPGNEDWGLLEHAQHRVPSTPKDRENFQFELGDATQETAPPGMPYAANDGWRVVTVRKWGQTSNRLNGSRLMLNVHDYASNEVLRRMYGRIARFPKPGTWGKNPQHVFHSADYTYNGQTPLVMSEIGGRALLNRTARGVFAYGKIHRDPEAWAQELGELITLMGELAIVRGGYVLTQTRDAGNDPDDPTSRGRSTASSTAAASPNTRATASATPTPEPAPSGSRARGSPWPDRPPSRGTKEEGSGAPLPFRISEARRLPEPRLSGSVRRAGSPRFGSRPGPPRRRTAPRSARPGRTPRSCAG